MNILPILFFVKCKFLFFWIFFVFFWDCRGFYGNDVWRCDYWGDDEEEDTQLKLGIKGTYTVDEKALKVRLLDESDSFVYEGSYSEDLSAIILDGETFKKVSK